MSPKSPNLTKNPEECLTESKRQPDTCPLSLGNRTNYGDEQVGNETGPTGWDIKYR